MTVEHAEPTLSIIIPAYNAQSTLGRQLEALLRQSGAPREILVCDNGSTDRTARIVTELSSQHPELRLVDASARRGPAAARNIGVAASTGEWIAFCDADDMVADGWCDSTRDALTRHAFVAGKFDVDRLQRKGIVSVSWSPQVDCLSALSYLPGYVAAGSGNMAMHRTVFETVGGFDEAEFAAEDDDFCIRAQTAGFRLTFAPMMLLHVQQRVGFRAIYRQAFSYGKGARRMAHKYANLAASTTITEDGSSGGARPPFVDPPVDTGTRLLRLTRSVLTSAAWANLVWRVGWASGWRQTTKAELAQIESNEAYQ